MESTKPSTYRSLKQTAESLLSLQVCLLNELMERAGLIEPEVERREHFAQHEAGHALVHLLEGQKIGQARVKRLREMTVKKLAKVTGWQATVGYVGFEDTVARKIYDMRYPDRETIANIAGLAAEKQLRNAKLNQLDKFLEECLAQGVDCEWSDVSVPCLYIKNRFEVLHQRVPTQNEITEIFYKILAELEAVFSNKQFTNALTCIKELIIDDKLKSNVNEKISKQLATSGFTQEDFEEMKKQLFGINIDKIIQAHSM